MATGSAPSRSGLSTARPRGTTTAFRVARALEPYRSMWIEDMLLPGNFQQYRQLAEATSLPLIAEERRGATRSLKCWNRAPSSTSCLTCAGAEGFPRRARSLAMADSYQLPIAPHTAGGPLLFYASTHLSTASMNVWIQESCQRFYEHDWPAMLVWHHPAAVVEAAQVS